MRSSAKHDRASIVRRGIATLEFAMALPFLLLLMVGITWLGFSVVTQTEVLVQARDKAWTRRFDNPKQKPLLFPAGLVVAKNPLYSYSDDYVTETVTKPVDVSPIFKAAPAPKASHTILSGSWDHRAMDMNSPPNFKLYFTAAANVVTGNIQTQLGSLSNLIESVENSGAAVIAQALTQGSNFDGMNSSSNSAGRQAEQETKQKEQADKAKLQQELSKLGGVINPLNNQVMPVSGGELDQTNDELDTLKAQLYAKQQAPASTNADQEKKRLAEIDQLKRQIELLQDKKQRIESEIRGITEELKAYDD
ncbi:MAG TPA: TadE/TadG family type IV pilus assembly protein [Lacipirellulaceae bacterium]|nr:TadE/TadG family type IV pilus assembly protein [Lacipirellulaceae bacterium]